MAAGPGLQPKAMFQTIAQIREQVKNPRNKKPLAEAKAHQNKVRLHTVPTSQPANNPAYRDHLRWVESLLGAEDKIAAYRQLLLPPLSSVDLTTEISTKLSKIFDGRDPAYRAVFTADNLEEDWLQYREEQLVGLWKSQAWQYYKESPNCVCVIDLAREAETPRAAPYVAFIDLDCLIDYKVNSNDDFEYVIFKEGNELFAYDDSSYRVFDLGEDGDYDSMTLIVEQAHDLGYCPARWLIKKSLNTQERHIKANAIAPYLGALDFYLFFSTSKRHLDLYVPYPIFWFFGADCDYQETSRDGTMIYTCKSGLLTYNNTAVRRSNGEVAHCPQCSKKRLHGPGTIIEVDPPTYQNEGTDLRNPIGIVNADTSSLQYNVTEEDRLADKLTYMVTGDQGAPINDQAVNEKQVGAIHENRTKALNEVKEPLEATQQWAEQTMCLLRYGQQFVSLSISYGTQYYLSTPDELLDRYQKARKDGADDLTLDQLLKEYHETKYRHNPRQTARVNLITQLDPYRHMTKAEVRSMYERNLIDYQSWYLKMNFSTLIAQFERQNGPITRFGSSLPPDRRVDMIRETIYGAIPEKPAQAPIEPQTQV